MLLGLGRRLSWLPLVGFAWRIRVLVGAVAVVRSLQRGDVTSAVIVTVFIALTYLMPVWRRRWEQHLVRSADRYVADAGLAPELVGLLRRQPADGALLDRIDRAEESARRRAAAEPVNRPS